MIKIEFSLMVALYLILTMCIILILWMISEKRKILGLFSSDRSFFWQCNICTYVYVDSRHSMLSQCPRCGSYNKKEESTESAPNYTQDGRVNSA